MDPKDEKQEDDFIELSAEEESQLQEEETAGAEEQQAAQQRAAEDEPAEGGEEAPLTIEQLQEKITRLETARQEDRRYNYRLREQRRMLREQLDQATQRAQPEVELGQDDLEFNEEKQTYTIKPEARAKLQPQQQQRSALQGQADAYERMRSDFINSQDDQAMARDAVEHLQGAYVWLDREIGRSLNEMGVPPERVRGLGALMDLVKEEGIQDRFEKEYPGVEIDELVMAATDPYLFNRLGRRYVAAQRKGKPDQLESEGDTAEETPSKEGSALRMGRRPRSMARRGGAARRAGNTTAKDWAELSVDEVLSMSDEDFEEMEKAASR